ncbi:Aste57867_18647 [Aphanomyces stellatus]|uniref:Aste57867_18647 protein n=1 Tax=Aphanomyces stellatus TaxID=120398 RepID=A0A485LCC6_9STRA|nr:hypothetical protein As57867_018585 [Aphanomyces stellatus]VFT95382.1 Aste57867_18647 [Aphanomyces stellatus]
MAGDFDLLVETLDQGGASIQNLIDSVDAATGMTPLHHSCRHGFVDIACYLVRHGAAVGVVDKFKKSPLHYACHFGHHEVVYVYLDCERVTLDKFYYMNEAKLTCLQTAAARGYVTIMRLLLLHGDVVDGLNEAGETALHLTAQYNHVEAAKLLVQCGASIQTKAAGTGDTPLHVACRHGATDVAVFLVQLGQSIHQTNGDVVPQSALQLARNCGHSMVANAIVEAAKTVRATRAASDMQMEQDSLQLFDAAKHAFREAKAARVRARAESKRSQRIQEMEAINTYLKAVRSGVSLVEAENIFATFPRLAHI